MDKYFKEEKIESLRNRFGSFIKIYNKGVFPVNINMLGFGVLKINSREELLGRITELAELIGESYMPQTKTIKESDGSINKEYNIKWLQ